MLCFDKCLLCLDNTVCVWKSVCCVPGIYVVVFEEQFVVFADVGHRRSGTPLRTKCSKFLPLLSNTDHQ